MTRKSKEEQIALLDLDGLSLGEPIALTLPIGPARGLAGSEPHAMYALLDRAHDIPLLPVKMQALRECGMEVRVGMEDPYLLELTSADGEPLLVVVKGDEAGVRWDPRAPSTMLIDARRAAPVHVRLPDGTGLVILDDDVAPQIRPVRPLEEALRAPPPIMADLRQWSQATSDPWMRSFIETRSHVTDPWRVASVAGVLARLEEGFPRGLALEEIAAHFSGTGGAATRMPRKWARDLGAEAHAFLCRLLEAEVESIEEDIRDLEADFRPLDDDWRSDLLRACQSRDDVTGVRLLLMEAGAWDESASLLGELDYGASLFIDSLPLQIELHDERLYRTFLRDPDAWWARLAEPRE